MKNNEYNNTRADELRRQLWPYWEGNEEGKKELRKIVNELNDLEPNWMEKMLVPKGQMPSDIHVEVKGPLFVKWREQMKLLVVEEGASGDLPFFHDLKNLEEAFFADDINCAEIGFYWCSNLKKVRLPQRSDRLRYGVFQNCEKLVEFNWPEGLETIPDCAFCGCRELKTDRIPDGVEKIGSHAFLSCKGLESIFIPDSVTLIADRAFDGCSNLKEVSVPGTIDWGRDVFTGCGKIHFEVRTPLEPFHRIDASLITAGMGSCVEPSMEELAYMALYSEKPVRQFAYSKVDENTLLDAMHRLIGDNHLKLGKRQSKNLRELEAIIIERSGKGKIISFEKYKNKS